MAAKRSRFRDLVGTNVWIHNFRIPKLPLLKIFLTPPPLVSNEQNQNWHQTKCLNIRLGSMAGSKILSGNLQYFLWFDLVQCSSSARWFSSSGFLHPFTSWTWSFIGQQSTFIFPLMTMIMIYNKRRICLSCYLAGQRLTSGAAGSRTLEYEV